ncbi:hypothetical protein BASA81_016122 [Batrachochytrium salamandrivorans]|nr:hypothetical protein BASA81_016122 [Batrachochytrium salamandrivorans]
MATLSTQATSEALPINVGLKLVCKVLQMRIERFVETNNLLSYEQAGFRKREECVGQVVSLVDIIQRRQNAGLNTHVLFIDIRKAFDTVPVGALLWKLQNMGFPRRTLAFLKALYTSSSARARAVPGLPRDTNPIRGLMYADDVAVFADSEQSLLAASTAIEQWANQWECSLVWPMVMGKAYMGLSWLVATSRTLHHCRRLNKGIRLFTGARLSTAIGPLLVETGIGSLLTRSLVSRAVGKIPALVLVSSDQTAIQEQILADTTSQTKDSQATTLVCIDGDSANMWRLCIAPKSGLVPAIQKSRLRLLGRALDPGVENVYTWLRGGVLNGEADLDQRWLDGTVEHESMGTRHDNRALAARLADFLQVAYRQYQSTLWKYHRDRLVEVG